MIDGEQKRELHLDVVVQRSEAHRGVAVDEDPGDRDPERDVSPGIGREAHADGGPSGIRPDRQAAASVGRVRGGVEEEELEDRLVGLGFPREPPFSRVLSFTAHCFGPALSKERARTYNGAGGFEMEVLELALFAQCGFRNVQSNP